MTKERITGQLKRLAFITAISALLAAGSAGLAGDPSQWLVIAGDPSQWGQVAGDPSQSGTGALEAALNFTKIEY